MQSGLGRAKLSGATAYEAQVRFKIVARQRARKSLS